MPDEYSDGFKAGWESALLEAERQCRPSVSSTGHTVYATTNVELVMLRNAVKGSGS